MHSHFDGTFAVIGGNICFLEAVPLSTFLVDFVLQSELDSPGHGAKLQGCTRCNKLCGVLQNFIIKIIAVYCLNRDWRAMRNRRTIERRDVIVRIFVSMMQQLKVMVHTLP